MQYGEEKLVVVRLFYNVSSSFLLLFILFYFTFNLLAKILHYCGSPILQRHNDVYDYIESSEEEKEDDEEEETESKINAYFGMDFVEKDHLVADIIHDDEFLQFIPVKNIKNYNPEISIYEEPKDELFCTPASESEVLEEVDVNEKHKLSGNDSEAKFCEHFENATIGPRKSCSGKEHEKLDVEENKEKHIKKGETNFTQKENYLVSAPSNLESKKFQVLSGKNVIEEEIYGDTYTIGSTSKDSSEWRSSINCRDAGSEDPFSSSSRRSCPKWESYTVFQKYDEEMLFLDRISVQKLHETETLRSIQACPRSISERIVLKFATKNKYNSLQNPYYELEAAYVAQICLTWEALNWNYEYFQRLRASRRESDPGCPAYVAQQFQQFQVLLQRYVETEPYEYGRRPEIYARIRSKAPKLLQVPEYRDSIDDEKEGLGSRIASNWFLEIMEDSIKTFMKFLKGDKQTHCQIMASFFKRNRRKTVDPTHLLSLKKVNKKKKLKIKDFRRAGKCIRKRRLKQEEEMEILMALIDLKVVSRVLRMAELSEEQLSWCDNKMSKVRVGDGKFQRESSPLFFPAH